jgi:hypothetical protein
MACFGQSDGKKEGTLSDYKLEESPRLEKSTKKRQKHPLSSEALLP